MKFWKFIPILAILALLAACAAPEARQITLFVPDDDAMYLEEVPAALVLSPQAVVDALFEDVTVNRFALEDGHITLDLSETFRTQLAATGTAGEQLLLAGLTNTFLRAYQAADLRLTCEGQVLETGHQRYDDPLEFADLARP